MDLIDELRTVLPHEGGVLTDPDLLVSYERDQADLVPYGTPSVVVRPRNAVQVSAILRAASRYHVPVVPQGARSGLAGGANAIEGAIVLSLINLILSSVATGGCFGGLADVGRQIAELQRIAKSSLFIPAPTAPPSTRNR